MPTPDEKFETYLKQFHPHEPAPLPLATLGRRQQTSRGKSFAKETAVAAAIMLTVLIAYPRVKHATPVQKNQPVSVSRAEVTQPLTIRSANAMLSAAPSFKAAIDDMAFPSPKTLLPKDARSALEVLSQGPKL